MALLSGLIILLIICIFFLLVGIGLMSLAFSQINIL